MQSIAYDTTHWGKSHVKQGRGKDKQEGARRGRGQKRAQTTGAFITRKGSIVTPTHDKKQHARLWPHRQVLGELLQGARDVGRHSVAQGAGGSVGGLLPDGDAALGLLRHTDQRREHADGVCRCALGSKIVLLVSGEWGGGGGGRARRGRARRSRQCGGAERGAAGSAAVRRAALTFFLVVPAAMVMLAPPRLTRFSS